MSFFPKRIVKVLQFAVAVLLTACQAQPAQLAPASFKLTPDFARAATWTAVSSAHWTKVEAHANASDATFFIEGARIYRLVSMVPPATHYLHPYLVPLSSADSKLVRASMPRATRRDDASPATGLFVHEGSWTRPPTNFGLTVPYKDDVVISSRLSMPKIFVAFEADCLACRQEIPALLETAKATKGRAAMFIISTEHGDQVKRLFGDQAQGLISFIEDRQTSFYAALAMTTVPHMFYQTASGKVVYIEDGTQSLGQMQTQVAAILP